MNTTFNFKQENNQLLNTLDSISRMTHDAVNQAEKILKNILEVLNVDKVEDWNEFVNDYCLNNLCVSYDGGNHPEYNSNVFSTVYGFGKNQQGELFFVVEESDEYEVYRMERGEFACAVSEICESFESYMKWKFENETDDLASTLHQLKKMGVVENYTLSYNIDGAYICNLSAIGDKLTELLPDLFTPSPIVGFNFICTHVKEVLGIDTEYLIENKNNVWLKDYVKIKTGIDIDNLEKLSKKQNIVAFNTDLTFTENSAAISVKELTDKLKSLLTE